MPLKTYDDALSVLQSSLDAARLGDADKLSGFERLHWFIRAVEQQYPPQADFNAAVAHEKKISRELGGRSLFD